MKKKGISGGVCCVRARVALRARTVHRQTHVNLAGYMGINKPVKTGSNLTLQENNSPCKASDVSVDYLLEIHTPPKFAPVVLHSPAESLASSNGTNNNTPTDSTIRGDYLHHHHAGIPSLATILKADERRGN